MHVVSYWPRITSSAILHPFSLFAEITDSRSTRHLRTLQTNPFAATGSKIFAKTAESRTRSWLAPARASALMSETIIGTAPPIACSRSSYYRFTETPARTRKSRKKGASMSEHSIATGLYCNEETFVFAPLSLTMPTRLFCRSCSSVLFILSSMCLLVWPCFWSALSAHVCMLEFNLICRASVCLLVARHVSPSPRPPPISGRVSLSHASPCFTCTRSDRHIPNCCLCECLSAPIRLECSCRSGSLAQAFSCSLSVFFWPILPN